MTTTLTIVRHALAILLLPFLVVVIVPWLLLASSANDSPWRDRSLVTWLPGVCGILLFLLGFGLFSWCVTLFARVGQGTLAPWDPTRRLVAVGPYRLVRNPMISGVALMLAGQSLFWESGAVGTWAAMFASINHIYFILVEEPGLENRFGERYRVYKQHVPRWLPRLRPWSTAL